MNIKSSFKNLGYCFYDPKYDYKLLDNSRVHFKQILYKCENEIYKKIRVYDDYLFKINIAGIENIFDKEIINQDILNLLNNSNIINLAKSLLDDDNIILTLSRYHFTSDITHCGIWHRDANPNDSDSVQINLYLFDETGMEIIPNSHLRDNLAEEEIVLNSKPYSNLSNSEKITVKAGKILAFNSSLIHRGKTLNKRAHLHFRFNKKKNLKKINVETNPLDYLDNYSIDKEIKNLIIDSASYGYIFGADDYFYNKSFKNIILRALRLFIHKFLFFLNYDNRLYLKFNVRPCLKMRKLFKID